MNKGLIFVLLIVWCAGSSWYYVCEIKCVCANSVERMVDVEEKASNSITFLYNSPEPVKGTEYEVVMDSMKKCLADGGTIIVTCLSNRAEDKVAGNTGKGSRAEAMGLLLASSGIKEGVEYKHADIDAWPDSTQFQAYRWECREKEVVATVEESISGAIIYFPSGSEQKLNNAEVDTYLQKLASTLKAKPVPIKIVGHSDAVGEAKANFDLAMKRAETVKSLLMNLGVAADKIQVSSKGEDQPIADNANDDGRARNRR
ncbi:MAG: OmpA family protein, partial [Saprospiraceae bacterium]